MGAERGKTVSYDKFLALGTNKLSDFLAVRGLKTSGTHVELVARAFAAAELNIPIIATSEEQQCTLKVQYEKLLNDSGITDPRAIPENEKVDDITKWPPVTLGCIFSFILKVKDFDREYIGKYKDQKAYSYFDSGFVGAILINFPDIKPHHVLIFCNVTASQSINEQKQLWILINKQTGEIVAAWCSCMAGTSRCCNHVIAALYKIDHAKTHGYCDPLCTSVPCEWNKANKRNVIGRKISEIYVRKKERSNLEKKHGANFEEIRCQALSEFDPRIASQKRITNEEVSDLFASLHECSPSAVVFKSIEEPHDSACMKTLYMSELAKNSKHGDKEKQVEQFLQGLVTTQQEIEKIEQLTRGQSGNKLWLRAREGRLTASKHHEIYTKVNSLSRSRGPIKPRTTPLVASLINRTNDLSNLPAVKWGMQHEDDALKQFYASEAVQHKGFKLKNCGIFIHHQFPYIAASPDAILECK